MLVLGHAGITLGIAILLSGAVPSRYILPNRTNQEQKDSSQLIEVSSNRKSTAIGRFTWLYTLADKIDIRILLIGSLLPDIIDKPFGLLFFGETLSSGRIFSHTLLFLILITIAGLYIYRRQRKTYLLSLSFGTFIHLVLDEMWRVPQTLLWPFYGLQFDKVDTSEWLPGIFDALFTDPMAYIPELVGAVILTWFAITLLYRRKVLQFLKSGQLR